MQRQHQALILRRRMERVKAATLTAVTTTCEIVMFLSVPALFMGTAAMYILKHQQEIITFLLS
jgi:hypothetical protein